MATLSDASSIAPLCLHSSLNHLLKVQLPQTQHRINLINHWNITEGQHVLELGCGQGDTTAVLAAAVGETGSVTALDPAPLDYGSPYTLGQAQTHLAASALGPRIQFIHADTLPYLESSTQMFDVAVLAHSIWYFASPALLDHTLRLLSERAHKVVIAEYSLTAAVPSSVPHVLAVLAQASLECRKLHTNSNVRTVLAPARIAASASAAGLVLKDEKVLSASEGMLDGAWEVATVLCKDFEDEVREAVGDVRERAVVDALVDSTRAAKNRLEGESVTTMDIWSAIFESSNA